MKNTDIKKQLTIWEIRAGVFPCNPGKNKGCKKTICGFPLDAEERTKSGTAEARPCRGSCYLTNKKDARRINYKSKPLLKPSNFRFKAILYYN